MTTQRTYLAVDLKSYYAAAECTARGLDPLTTNLVVADPSRTEKTVCLAVSPALKAYSIPGRARLFEVISAVKNINRQRLRLAPQHCFHGASFDALLLKNDPSLKLTYITAPPRMSYYIELSAKIYASYLRYVSKKDIHVYSIDECFMDITDYLPLYKKTPVALAEEILENILIKHGIPASAGLGTNLYLAKIALDIMAKKCPSAKGGLCVAELDEYSFRKNLWNHRPLTDFWQIGRGLYTKLAANGMYTMGDIARCSLYNEERLYKLFGINAELLIDHAWGIEPCTIKTIKEYRPKKNSLCSGQVLHRPYSFSEGRIVLKEMLEDISLDLAAKYLTTDAITLHVCYDIVNMKNAYRGPLHVDHYGRTVPAPAHGTVRLGTSTFSTKIITDKVISLYDRIVSRQLYLRRFSVNANGVLPEEFYQQDLFAEQENLEKERRLQQTLLRLKKRFGKNAVLRGTSLTEGATAMERNNLIGGHKA